MLMSRLRKYRKMVAQTLYCNPRAQVIAPYIPSAVMYESSSILAIREASSRVYVSHHSSVYRLDLAPRPPPSFGLFKEGVEDQKGLESPAEVMIFAQRLIVAKKTREKP